MVKLKKVYESANRSSFLDYLKKNTYLRVGKTEVGFSSSSLPLAIEGVAKAIIDQVKFSVNHPREEGYKEVEWDTLVYVSVNYPSHSTISWSIETSNIAKSILYTFSVENGHPSLLTGKFTQNKNKVSLNESLSSNKELLNEGYVSSEDSMLYFMRKYNEEHKNEQIDEDDMKNVYLPFIKECRDKLDKLCATLLQKPVLKKILDLVCKDGTIKAEIESTKKKNLKNIAGAKETNKEMSSLAETLEKEGCESIELSFLKDTNKFKVHDFSKMQSYIIDTLRKHSDYFYSDILRDTFDEKYGDSIDGTIDMDVMPSISYKFYFKDGGSLWGDVYMEGYFFGTHFPEDPLEGNLYLDMDEDYNYDYSDKDHDYPECAQLINCILGGLGELSVPI